ncbi:MAG: helix-turn-helix domain-containing protein [Saprospiraceae bacterium]|nr:helix-turn-helix domain-containing protein [Saprospiraceae bacterium]
MIFQSFQPGPPLDQYVRDYVYYRDYRPDHNIDRLVPDGSVSLLIALNDNPQYLFDNVTLEPVKKFQHSWISGMQETFLTISSGSGVEMIVVSFLPGGCFPFLGMPVTELRNQVIEASVVFGREIEHLRERLGATTAEFYFQIITSWLLAKLYWAETISPVIRFGIDKISSMPSKAAIAEIVDRSGYSSKQFIHLFKSQVGVTPKSFQRISRFNKILSEIYGKNSLNWIGLADDFGYYDQSHFIKDFRNFSGINPELYISSKGAYMHYVPIR